MLYGWKLLAAIPAELVATTAVGVVLKLDADAIRIREIHFRGAIRRGATTVRHTHADPVLQRAVLAFLARSQTVVGQSLQYGFHREVLNVQAGVVDTARLGGLRL